MIFPKVAAIAKEDDRGILRRNECDSERCGRGAHQLARAGRPRWRRRVGLGVVWVKSGVGQGSVLMYRTWRPKRRWQSADAIP